MPGVVGGLHRRRSGASAPHAAERQRGGRRRARWKVRSAARCSHATWCGSWASRSRWWSPSRSRAGQDAAEVVLPDLEPLAAVTDVEAAARRRRPAAVARPRHRTSRRVRGALGRRRAGGRRRRGARPVREPARSPPCPWSRTRSRSCPTATAGTRSGSRRRCRSTCATIWPSCSRCDKEQVRTIAPDVGGGFGAKLQIYPEYLVVAVAAAKARAGRSAGWRRGRRSMLSLTHGRAQVQLVEIGAKRDGTIVGLRVPTCSPTWARTRSARSCPPRRRRCWPASTRSATDRVAVDAASSRTPRRSRPIAAPAGPRPRR